VLQNAVAVVPPGAWAVGVSGGADSVALLRLLRDRSDLSLRVVHLDHQLRGDESDADAASVEALARSLNLPMTLVRRSDLEPGLADLPKNPAAKYRRLRLTLFAATCDAHGLQGVILAHHADDLAETVLQRLARGSGWETLTAMRTDAVVRNVRIVRPLLHIRGKALREYLQSIKQNWREDSSNESDRYSRNRVRKILWKHPQLIDLLLELSRACGELEKWVDAHAPPLGETFGVNEFANLPELLARRAGARWLAARGVPREELSAEVVGRLIAICADASNPALNEFPGSVRVRRRRGRVSAG